MLRPDADQRNSSSSDDSKRPFAWTVSAIALLVLAGCTVPIQPAKYDPYQGLLPTGMTISAREASEPIHAAGKSAGVIISNSTERQLEYNEQVFEAFKLAVNQMMGPTNFELVKPDFIAVHVLSKLKEKFASVGLYDDFAALSRDRLDYGVLIDIANRFPDNLNHTYRYELDLYIHDASLHRVAVITSSAEEYNTCMGNAACPNQVRVRLIRALLADFDRQMDRVFPPSTPSDVSGPTQ